MQLNVALRAIINWLGGVQAKVFAALVILWFYSHNYFLSLVLCYASTDQQWNLHFEEVHSCYQ